MYSHTKKIGSMGRYGPRTGRKVREEAKKIEEEARRHKNCPSCGKENVKRLAAGIWTCKSCDSKFTGGAHMLVSKKKVSLEEATLKPPETAE